jgi:hypothetical protein
LLSQIPTQRWRALSRVWPYSPGGQKAKRKKQKVTGEFRAPAMKKEERKEEEEYYGLDRPDRVLRPDEAGEY